MTTEARFERVAVRDTGIKYLVLRIHRISQETLKSICELLVTRGLGEIRTSFPCTFEQRRRFREVEGVSSALIPFPHLYEGSLQLTSLSLKTLQIAARERRINETWNAVIASASRAISP